MNGQLCDTLCSARFRRHDNAHLAYQLGLSRRGQEVGSAITVACGNLYGSWMGSAHEKIDVLSPRRGEERENVGFPIAHYKRSLAGGQAQLGELESLRPLSALFLVAEALAPAVP